MTGKSATAGTVDTRLADALGERYLSYALSTITARSLPDVRDGLKPVHRRLLYAMRELRLNPDQGFKKCARIVGDVMGRYHPHGDAAIYDAMVRLAQDFAVRYPLVDGQGNFGNVDGDNAAAMRYTEARLTAVAEALLEGIGEDAVDFRPTYDDEGEEPVVLPAAFPNLLANGASGIAVGMATSIPPHNAGEICKALLHLMKYPKATVGKLTGFMPGPDLPTGGVLVEPPDSIVEAYRTGRGGFRLRARWAVEKRRGGTWIIVVTEIPWQVPKSRLVEKIAELMAAKKLPMLADIHDESAADIRLVLEPKSRSLDPAAVMEHLFRVTDLEVRIGLNMNVLDAAGVPRVMDLRAVLQAFVDHRMEVLGRRTRYRVEKFDRRIEVLEGRMVAYLNLDEVIQVIREEDEPGRVMMKRWKLSAAQAEAILDMRLRALRKLEEIAIREELAARRRERKDLKGLLGDRKRQLAGVAGEIRESGKRFGDSSPAGARRTLIATPPTATVVPLEIAIEREPVTVICSDKGWIRAVRGHLEDGAGLKFKEGDRGRFLIHAQTTDRLLVFGTNGRFYTVGVDRLPRGRGHGEPLRLMIDLGGEAEDIVSILVCRPDARLLVASADGRGFLVPAESVVARTRQGRQVLNLGEGTEARVCVPAEGDTVAVLGENRKLLLFPLAELPEMGRGRGTVLQKYHGGGLADVMVFRLADGLTCRTGSRQRTFQDLDDWRGKRANAGRKVPAGFPKSGRFDQG